MNGGKMEGFKKFLNNIIHPAALIYTVFSALYYIASSTLSTDPGTKSYGILMLALLVYAVILALMLGIFRTKLPYIARTLIHYAMVAGSILLIFAIAGSAFSPDSIIFAFSVFTVIYIIIAAPVLIFLYRKKAKENETQDYKSAFSGKK